jgi:hypothetical protein
MKRILINLVAFSAIFMVLAAPKMAFAQTPTDAIMMEKGQLCIAAIYGHDAWDEYWEGTLKRNNGNIGTFTRQSVMGMFSLGITDKINVLGALPWMKTAPSAGQMKGAQGIQDWGLWVKAQAFDLKLGKGSLGFYPVLGLTGPASKYLPDYMPFSLGLGCMEASLRGILIYEHDKGFYLRGNIAYHLRSNTKIERDYYYTDHGIYSDKVDMPNAATYAATLGALVLKNSLKIELTYDGMNTLGGFDIRRNDMPFPSNNMEFTRIGANFQYYFPKPKGFSVIAAAGQVLSGRNMGQSSFFSGGLSYQFGVWK